MVAGGTKPLWRQLRDRGLTAPNTVLELTGMHTIPVDVFELVRQLDPAFLARRSVRSGTRPAEVPF